MSFTCPCKKWFRGKARDLVTSQARPLDRNEKKVKDILSLLMFLETDDVFESVRYNPIGVQIP